MAVWLCAFLDFCSGRSFGATADLMVAVGVEDREGSGGLCG